MIFYSILSFEIFNSILLITVIIYGTLLLL